MAQVPPGRPRHALRPARRRMLTGLVVAGVAVAGTAGALFATGVLPGAGGAGAVGAGSTGPVSPSASGPAAASPACAAPVDVAADPAYAATFTRLAATHARGGCPGVRITSVPSSEVAKSGLGAARAWIPEDASWVERAAGVPGAATAKQVAVASSPLVLATTPELKAALGGQPVAGETLRSLITLDKSFADYGKPEWGRFRLVLPDPGSTATGALGFVTLTQLVGRGEAPPTDLGTATPNQLDIPQVQYRVAELTRTAGEVPDKLKAVAADATPTNPAGPRAGVTTEFAALNAPAGTLSAVPLSDGRAGVRIPVVLPGDAPEAAAFATWLTSDAGQAALADAGLHTAGHAPDAARLTAIGLTPPTAPVAATPGAALEAAGALYQGLAQRMSILTVIDLSGSMAKEVAPGVRAIDLVTKATLALDWKKWAPGAYVGFMTFHTDPAQKPLIETPLPLTANTAPEYPALAEGFLAATRQLRVGHGTPLNQAILQAYQYAEQKKVAGYVTRVIVLTDGKNEDAEPLLSEADLIAKLPKASAESPRLVLVALGPEADHAALDRIAAATGHKSLWVQDIAQYPQMVQKIMYGE